MINIFEPCFFNDKESSSYRSALVFKRKSPDQVWRQGISPMVALMVCIYIYYKYVKTIFQIWLHVPDPIEKIWLTQVWLNSPIDVSNYDSIIEPWIWGPSPIYWQTEFSWAQILHQLPYHFGIAMVTGLDHRYLQKNKLVDMGDSLWLTALMGFFTDFNGIL
jgi:hypothetical protein